MVNSHNPPDLLFLPFPFYFLCRLEQTPTQQKEGKTKIKRRKLNYFYCPNFISFIYGLNIVAYAFNNKKKQKINTVQVLTSFFNRNISFKIGNVFTSPSVLK